MRYSSAHSAFADLVFLTPGAMRFLDHHGDKIEGSMRPMESGFLRQFGREKEGGTGMSEGLKAVFRRSTGTALSRRLFKSGRDRRTDVRHWVPIGIIVAAFLLLTVQLFSDPHLLGRVFAPVVA